MFIPLKDRDAYKYAFPAASGFIIILNSVVFFYQLTLSYPELRLFFLTWGMIPERIVTTLSLDALATVVTSMFLHAGWFHFLGNMLYLWVFGLNVEEHLGRGTYLVVYPFCGIVAGITHLLINPHSPLPLIGASGAIAGVLGAYIIAYPRSKIKTGFFWGLIRVNLPAWLLLGLWFVMNLFNGYGSLASAATGGGVAYWAHIGGFVAGAFIMALFNVLESFED